MMWWGCPDAAPDPIARLGPSWPGWGHRWPTRSMVRNDRPAARAARVRDSDSAGLGGATVSRAVKFTGRETASPSRRLASARSLAAARSTISWASWMSWASEGVKSLRTVFSSASARPRLGGPNVTIRTGPRGRPPADPAPDATASRRAHVPLDAQGVRPIPRRPRTRGNPRPEWTRVGPASDVPPLWRDVPLGGRARRPGARLCPGARGCRPAARGRLGPSWTGWGHRWAGAMPWAGDRLRGPVGGPDRLDCRPDAGPNPGVRVATIGSNGIASGRIRGARESNG